MRKGTRHQQKRAAIAESIDNNSDADFSSVYIVHKGDGTAELTVVRGSAPTPAPEWPIGRRLIGEFCRRDPVSFERVFDAGAEAIAEVRRQRVRDFLSERKAA